MIKFVGPEEIEDQEDGGYDRVVETIFNEWIGGSSEKPEVATEENEAADIPAHDEHAHRYADKCCTERIHFTKILGSQVECMGAEGLHECSIHSAEQDKPKQEKDLVFPKMQEQ